jgi:hypothetical protein
LASFAILNPVLVEKAHPSRGAEVREREHAVASTIAWSAAQRYNLIP